MKKLTFVGLALVLFLGSYFVVEWAFSRHLQSLTYGQIVSKFCNDRSFFLIVQSAENLPIKKCNNAQKVEVSTNEVITVSYRSLKPYYVSFKVGRSGDRNFVVVSRGVDTL